jgi:hypothetical protein
MIAPGVTACCNAQPILGQLCEKCWNPVSKTRLPPALARLQAWFLEHAPGGPIMSRDNLDSMRVDNVASPGTTPMPTAPEDVAPFYLGPQPSPTGYDHVRRRG